jgi:small subunit ribosomal protein S20
MANHPSADKRNRQRVTRTERNKRIRSAVRSAVKKARTAIAGGKPEAAKEPVAQAAKALARAASKGVVHVRTAARTTSRIESALAKLGRG